MRYYDLISTPQTGKTFLEDGTNRIPASDSRVDVYFQSIDKVKYDRSFDNEGYPILLEYALQEDGTRYSYYQSEHDGDGVYQPDVEKILEEEEAVEAEALKESESLRKLEGVEFEGILCSATAEDMWGLSSVESWVRSGVSTPFKFDNGNILTLTSGNIDQFYVVWTPFRASFF